MTWKRTSPGGVAVDAAGTAIADNVIVRGSGSSVQGSGWTIDDNDDMAVGALGDTIILDADGDTGIYCSADDQIRLKTSNTDRLLILDTRIVANVEFRTDIVRWTDTSAPTGEANTAKIFAQDNGGGKTQLMVVFGDDTPQQLAIEP